MVRFLSAVTVAFSIILGCILLLLVWLGLPEWCGGGILQSVLDKSGLPTGALENETAGCRYWVKGLFSDYLLGSCLAHVWYLSEQASKGGASAPRLRIMHSLYWCVVSVVTYACVFILPPSGPGAICSMAAALVLSAILLILLGATANTVGKSAIVCPVGAALFTGAFFQLSKLDYSYSVSRQMEKATALITAGDPLRAAYWYRKAAEQGNADACCKLGEMYGQGQGVPKDETLAEEWKHRADTLAAERNSHADTLSREEDNRETAGGGATPSAQSSAQSPKSLNGAPFGATSINSESSIGSFPVMNERPFGATSINSESSIGSFPVMNERPFGEIPSGEIISLGSKPHAEPQRASTTETRSSLQPLIDRMAALRCKQADSKLYRIRLLTLLPMIRDGADVDITTAETKGNTALHYAVAIGSLSITKWLLEHGANPNAVTDKGASVRKCVGSDNRSEILRLLDQYGARSSEPSAAPKRSAAAENRSSLQPLIDRMAALRCKQADSKLQQKRLLTLLPMIRDGADVDITTAETKGNTALHYAVAIGSLSITKWLLEHGANPNAVTDKGASVRKCVGSDNRSKILRLLDQYGAR